MQILRGVLNDVLSLQGFYGRGFVCHVLVKVLWNNRTCLSDGLRLSELLNVKLLWTVHLKHENYQLSQQIKTRQQRILLISRLNHSEVTLSLFQLVVNWIFWWTPCCSSLHEKLPNAAESGRAANGLSPVIKKPLYFTQRSVWDAVAWKRPVIGFTSERRADRTHWDRLRVSTCTVFVLSGVSRSKVSLCLQSGSHSWSPVDSRTQWQRGRGRHS